MVLREHAPVSRLTAAANLHGGTLHDVFRRLQAAEAAIIACRKDGDPRLQQKAPPGAQTTFTSEPYALTGQGF
jgi:hypothetical protein